LTPNVAEFLIESQRDKLLSSYTHDGRTGKIGSAAKGTSENGDTDEP